VLLDAFSGYSKTPMEKAIRICIDEAVKLIEAKTPKQYYWVFADFQPSDESITTSQPKQHPSLHGLFYPHNVHPLVLKREYRLYP
jgi:hypothetical protein